MAESHKRVDPAYCAIKAENNTWLSIGKTWQSAMWCRLGSVPKDTFTLERYWDIIWNLKNNLSI